MKLNNLSLNEVKILLVSFRFIGPFVNCVHYGHTFLYTHLFIAHLKKGQDSSNCVAYSFTNLLSYVTFSSIYSIRTELYIVLHKVDFWENRKNMIFYPEILFIRKFLYTVLLFVYF